MINEDIERVKEAKKQINIVKEENSGKIKGLATHLNLELKGFIELIKEKGKKEAERDESEEKS